MNDHGFLPRALLSHHSHRLPDTAAAVERTVHCGVLTVISASVIQTSAQRRGSHVGNLHWNLFFRAEPHVTSPPAGVGGRVTTGAICLYFLCTDQPTNKPNASLTTPCIMPCIHLYRWGKFLPVCYISCPSFACKKKNPQVIKQKIIIFLLITSLLIYFIKKQ